jgi:hypothetical protein
MQPIGLGQHRTVGIHRDGLGYVFPPVHPLDRDPGYEDRNEAVRWAFGKPAWIGVSTRPGETVLTRTGANSSGRVRPRRSCSRYLNHFLVAWYPPL